MRILPTPRPGHAAGGWGKIGGAEPVPLGNLVGSTVSARFSGAGRLGGGRRPEMSPYGGRILRHAISFYRFILRLCIDARGFQPYSFSPFRGMVRLPIVLRHLLLGRYPGDGPCRSLGSFLRFPGEIRLKSLPDAGRLIESRGNSLPRFRGYPQGPQASSAPRSLLFRSDSFRKPARSRATLFSRCPQGIFSRSRPAGEDVLCSQEQAWRPRGGPANLLPSIVPSQCQR